MPLTVVTFLAIGPAAGAGQALACPTDETQELSLTETWERSWEVEPGDRVHAQEEAAWLAAESSVGRERLPGLFFDVVGDQGQRLSPGEERELGPGPRVEGRFLASWTLLESSRRWRMEEARERAAEARLAGDAFEVEHLAEVGRVYLEAGYGREALRLAQAQRAEVEDLAVAVDRRLEEGIAREWEVTLLEEARSRAERRLAEAEQAYGQSHAELFVLTGVCVEPLWPGEDAELPQAERDPRVAADENPVARQLRQEARAQEAGAEAARRSDRWSLDLIGGVGPNYSRAFDGGRVEQEYLVGLSARWDVDLFGVRRGRAAEEGARARSLVALAESEERAAERQANRATDHWEHAERRRAELDRELESALDRAEVARLRWREGVGPWSEVVEALQRVDDARLERLEAKLEAMMALVDYAEAGDRMDRLPHWVGQETNR